MKLSVINKEREPESVAPKIKIYDTEADLDAALPDLKDGAIVATKEDETSEITESRDKVYAYKVTGTAEWTPYDCFFIADKVKGYVNIVMIKNTSQIVNVIWDVTSNTANYTGLGYADSVTTGLNDSKYSGKPFLNLRVALGVGDTKMHFITTKDCILEHIERR